MRHQAAHLDRGTSRGGSGAAGALVAIATTRGDGHSGAVRRSASGCERREALWTVGAVVQSRPDRLEGIITGAAVAAPARHGSDGDRRRRSVGHRCRAQRSSHPVPARRVAPPRCRHGQGTVGLRAEDQGAGCRDRHPSPTTDDRAGCHVHEPRGRDRADQHRRVEGMLGPLPHDRPECAGVADPRPARAHRRCHQHRRRRVDAAARRRPRHASRDFR